MSKKVQSMSLVHVSNGDNCSTLSSFSASLFVVWCKCEKQGFWLSEDQVNIQSTMKTVQNCCILILSWTKCPFKEYYPKINNSFKEVVVLNVDNTQKDMFLLNNNN